ncbi:MAG: tetratricopeptide repeat protein [Betaproteobacteria bacterium]|nr:tetratricopeptide repeat protein [Betaproteobacteria bacterium]
MSRFPSSFRRIALAALLCFPLLSVANMGSDTADTTDDPNMTDGRAAIEAQDWARAVDLMKKAIAANPDNADAHNWLGFAYRKLGRFDESFAQYDEALRLNPDHKAAREYLGEAYLMTGQLAKAEAQLAELRRLCTPIPCEEHKDLARAIDEYRKTHP